MHSIFKSLREYSLKAKRFAFQAKNMSSSLITRKMKSLQTSSINIQNYKHLLQYIIKQGKKNTVENYFRKGVFFWIQKNATKNFDLTLKNAFLNTTPYIGVKTKRKGTKKSYCFFSLYSITVLLCRLYVCYSEFVAVLFSAIN